MTDVEQPVTAAPETVSSGGEGNDTPATPDYTVPDWVDSVPTIPMPEAQPQPRSDAPVYAPPPAQWRPPQYDAQALSEKGSEVVDGHIREYVNPIVNALMEERQKREAIEKRFEEMAGKVGRPPEYVIERAYSEAQVAVKDALQRFSRESAFGNARVKAMTESFLKNSAEEAYRNAVQKGDFSGIKALSKKSFLNSIWAYCKEEAGYVDGQPPQPVSAPGAVLEQTRSKPAGGKRPPLDADTRAMLKKTHTSEEDYYKALDAAAEWDAKAGE